MKIAIAGTRGIPNNYGGFEQCAQFLSVLLLKMGHEVTVFNAHHHPYKENLHNGVHIVHVFNLEKKIGTIGNFIYDYGCMKHAVKNDFDILLVLGYTTASVFYPLINFKKTVLVTNMDGLEWKRDKWNSVVKELARWFEKLGANYSHQLVADNLRIGEYLFKTYNKHSEFIPYGCIPFHKPDVSKIEAYQVQKFGYGILIARMEAENNVAMVLEGFTQSIQDCKLLVVGNLSNAYGKKMKAMYSHDQRVVFTQGIYDLDVLNNLRYFSRYYFHGHSVGGTNPALLEAMASGAFVIAHGNEFNRSVLGDDALFFVSADDITRFIDQNQYEGNFRETAVTNNLTRVNEQYNWELVARKYEAFFQKIAAS